MIRFRSTGAGFDLLSPAEDQQLPGEPGGAFRGDLDLPGVRLHARQVSRVMGDEPGVVHDRGQQVVEVVRDPARQLPEDLQPLRPHLGLFHGPPGGRQPVPLGHVPGHGGRARHRAAAVQDGGHAHRHVDDRAVLADPPGLVRGHVFPPGDVAVDEFQLGQPVAGEEQGHVAPDDLVRGVAVHPGGPPVPAGDRAVQRLAEDGVIGRLDDCRQPGGQLELVAARGTGAGDSHGLPPRGVRNAAFTTFCYRLST